MSTHVVLCLIRKEIALNLLVTLDFDLALITQQLDDIFHYAAVMKKAMSDLNTDYSDELDKCTKSVANLKNAGVIGYPIDMHDGKLYALDRKISFEELEINCD